MSYEYDTIALTRENGDTLRVKVPDINAWAENYIILWGYPVPVKESYERIDELIRRKR